jgi:GNAT superfamily N-acetyltransferase
MAHFYTSTSKVGGSGLLTRWLTNEEGHRVCKAEFMHDKDGNAVVFELETDESHRGKGLARRLLTEIGERETSGQLRVTSNENARPYYTRLGYAEIAPYVFLAP